MKRIIWVILVLVLVVDLLSLSPWITKDYAERVVSREFSSKWQGVSDGCGFNCDGCGIKESHRTFFGYSVKIEYACGMLPSYSQEFHQTNTIYVSLFGTTHGFNKS